MVATPWAILCCKFNDNAVEPQPRDFYDRLFTSAGAGTHNMTDFFRDASHGSLDLSGSQVFGWFTLDVAHSAFAGNVDTPPPGMVNRNGLFDLCVQKARDNGVPIDSFFGVVVTMNVPTDLWGGGRRAFCDPLSLQPSYLGQEMGHGYGLDHSRRDGSAEDYQDPWDIMSTASAYEQSDPTYTFIGPNMNAWNMRGRGWLDESRVWRSSAAAFDATIRLRPLVRRDLPGLLAAEIPSGFLVEFRVTESWDRAIPRSAVLVHRFAENQSYIMANTDGGDDLGVGDQFVSGIETFAFEPYTRVEVVAIDPQTQVATLHLVHRPAVRPPRADIIATLVGGVTVDGGGGIIVGGHFHPVPPRSPEMVLLEQLALLSASSLAASVDARAAVQRMTLTALRDAVTRQLAGLEPFGVPAPRLKER